MITYGEYKIEANRKLITDLKKSIWRILKLNSAIKTSHGLVKPVSNI